MIKGEKFNKTIIKILKEHGAIDTNSSMYKWSIETIYGKLLISIPKPEKRQKLFTVFCRFDEPERSKEHTDCNPYSGKWNFHSSKMNDCIEIFDHHIKKITGITPTEKVLYEACKNALGFGSEKSLNRFVEPNVTLQQDLEKAIKMIEEKYNITTSE
jgi:hypothetical protein